MNGEELEKIRAVELVLGNKRTVVCPACDGKVCETCKGKKCTLKDSRCNGEPVCLTCKGIGRIISLEYRQACALLGVPLHRFRIEEVRQALRENYGLK
jgi:DnaJ-class molecular chaperone